MIGFDISNNNGNIDWAVVRRLGYAWCAIKASEGTGFVDKQLARNVANARSAGLRIVVYHFARPSRASGQAEASAFLTAVRSHVAVGDVLALDSEDTDVTDTADLAAHHEQFAWSVEAATGAPPWLYSGEWYMRQHNLTGGRLTRCGLWYASYTPQIPDVTALGWPFWAAWQYSASGVVPGIYGNVDLDTFAGTAEQFDKYGITRFPF